MQRSKVKTEGIIFRTFVIFAAAFFPKRVFFFGSLFGSFLLVRTQFDRVGGDEEGACVLPAGIDQVDRVALPGATVMTAHGVMNGLEVAFALSVGGVFNG